MWASENSYMRKGSGKPMPFDQKLYEPYCVRFSAVKNREYKDLLVKFYFVFVFLSLGLSIKEIAENGLIYIVYCILAYLLIGYLLIRWREKPGPETMKTWVQGDVFCTEMKMQRSRGYHFSEITRVSYHSQHSKMHKMPKTPPHWGIYIGEECVATFQNDMENAGKLLEKLKAYGLITTYLTGYKPKA